MITKVCGMCDPYNIRAIEQTGIEWMGFIFYPKSPRFIKSKPSYLPTRTKRVGVFVNEEIDMIDIRVQEFELDIVQLHGQESPEQCTYLRNKGIKVIKAFSISKAQDIRKSSLYEDTCDYFLFDTATPHYGGSGKQFDWNILHHYKGKTPFLLSGGIRPQNLNDIIKFNHPSLIGIDLNSGFETSPGIKDTVAVKSFVQTLKTKHYE